MKTFLGMPGYGSQSAEAGRALWRASANMDDVCVVQRGGSLLAANFNGLWCDALNMVHQGQSVDYFAMLHSDIGAPDGWLDVLISELEEKELDVLGVAVPIKDRRGLTSLAVHKEGDNWRPEARLTMREVYRLPSTFTSEDIGGRKLLLNTGCWVCRFNMDWAKQVHFEINDAISFNRATNQYEPLSESEDWYFSRLLHELQLKIGATRKILALHKGTATFANDGPWGTLDVDRHATADSVVPEVDRDGFRFPHDVEGWLDFDEGKELWRLSHGKRVLEIGSYCGRSTVCIAQSAREVIAVDPHDGRGTPSPQPTLDKMVANLDRYGVLDKVSIHHSTETIDGEYELIFIDGAHDFESVRRDINHAFTVIAPGGMLAFHDYRSPRDPGVTAAVDELIAHGGEPLSLNGTLAVVRCPAATLAEN